MSTYYSILSVLIRPEIQEKITLGLLLFDEEKIFFNYSKNKLTASKALLSEDSYKLLLDSVKNIKSKANNQNDLLGSKSSEQFTLHNDMLLNSFSPAYISYLSRYSNNILGFTDPKEIAIPASEGNFDSLFSRFIDTVESIIGNFPEQKPIELFKERNISRLKRHFNVDKKVTSREIPNLIIPVRLDLLGQNGMPVYAQTIDMDRRTYDIQYDVGQLLSLNTAFTQNNQPFKGFVVAQEPSGRDKEQHLIWRALKKSPHFEYVDISEGDRIIEYAEQHNVQPLVQDTDDPLL